MLTRPAYGDSRTFPTHSPVELASEPRYTTLQFPASPDVMDLMGRGFVVEPRSFELPLVNPEPGQAPSPWLLGTLADYLLASRAAGLPGRELPTWILDYLEFYFGYRVEFQFAGGEYYNVAV